MVADLSALYLHGGRISDAQAAFPHAPRPWLDLSTGVNPRPWYGRRAPDKALGRLPDPADVRRLEARAAEVFGTAPEKVVAIPGSEAAIWLLPTILGLPSVAVVGPTYSSHARAWTQAGAQVIDAADLPEALVSTAAAIVVVNPNNPDGRTLRPARLLAVDRPLIVDEAFAELAPEISVAPEAGDDLIVLRSFGKFYGLPGMRLGFAVTGPKVGARLRTAFGDWPLGADTIALGLAAYADARWAEGARQRLTREARRLDGLLKGAGMKIVGGTDLYRLVRTARAAETFKALCEKGILVRPFTDRPDLLRIGIPPPTGWKRLSEALG